MFYSIVLLCVPNPCGFLSGSSSFTSMCLYVLYDSTGWNFLYIYVFTFYVCVHVCIFPVHKCVVVVVWMYVDFVWMYLCYLYMCEGVCVLYESSFTCVCVCVMWGSRVLEIADVTLRMTGEIEVDTGFCSTIRLS